MRDRAWLLGLAIAYGAASLFHHAHNALYLSAYPNLPTSLTPARVMAAWVAQASVGILGYALLRHGRQRAGLVLLAIFGSLGYLGLAHYQRAPVHAHTAAMNASIGLEVVAGTMLLVCALVVLAGATARSGVAGR